MKKIFSYIILLTIVLILFSLILPSKIESKQEILLYSHKEQVYQQLIQIDSLLQWFPLRTDRGEIHKLNPREVIWESEGKNNHLKILSDDPHKVVYDVSEGNGAYKFILVFKILPLLENQVSLHSRFQTFGTVNLLNKFYNLFDKSKIKENQKTILKILKNRVEAYKYEKFKFQNVELINKKITCLTMEQTTTVRNLATTKENNISPHLQEKLRKYKLVDSTLNTFIQYTGWSDSIVSFNICQPIIEKPTIKQLRQLSPLKIKEDSSSYLSATFTGNTIDIGEAWDSLHHIAETKGYEIYGYPLEKTLKVAPDLIVKKIYFKVKQ